MKINNNMSQVDRSELFGTLIDVVEDWLESKGITPKDIPNTERDEADAEWLDEYGFTGAIIYGSDYDELANKFAAVLGIDRDNYTELFPEKE